MPKRDRKRKASASTTTPTEPSDESDSEDDEYLAYENETNLLTVYIQMLVEVAFTIPPLIAAICYTNSIYGQLFFDDKYAINRNADVTNTNWNSTTISSIFQHDYWGMPISDPSSHKSYRPFVTLTFKLNHYFHQLHPVGYHSTNILFHVCNTALVNMVARRTFIHIVETRVDVANAASMAALMFAVHPIHTEAVASVVGRAEVMCCFFFLLSLYMGMRAAQPSHTNWGAAIMVLIHMMASMLCKEQGITVMGVLFVFDFFCVLDPCWGSKIGYPSFKTRAIVFLKRNLLYVAFSVIFLKWRLNLNAGTMPTWPLLDNPAAAAGASTLFKMFNYPFIYAHNAWLLIFPLHLCGDYTYKSIAIIKDIEDPRNILTTIFLLFCYFLFYLGFGGGNFEYDSDEPCNTSEKFKQMEYIDNGKKVDLIWQKNYKKEDESTMTFSQQNKNAKIRKRKKAKEKLHSWDVSSTTGGKNSTNATNTTKNIDENNIDSIDLLDNALKAKGKSMFLNIDLTSSLLLRRDILMALAFIVFPFLPSSNLFFPVGFLIAERVLYIPSIGQALLFGSVAARTWDRTWRCCSHPYIQPKMILGCMCLLFAIRTGYRNGDWRTEESFWKSVISVNPTNSKAHFNYGNVMFSKGKLRESVLSFQESLNVIEDDPSTLVNMATSLYRLNRLDEALVAYEEASKYARGFGQYFNWGYIYESKNQYDRAIQIFDMASQFMPEGGRMALYQDDASAKAVCAIHLGTLLCRQKRSDQGLLAFYRAVAIDPKLQEAWMRMGLEHAVREGEKTKALYCLDRAANIDPKSREQIQSYLTSQGNIKEAARYNPKSSMPEQFNLPHGWDPEIIGKDSMQRYISDILTDTMLGEDQERRNAMYWKTIKNSRNVENRAILSDEYDEWNSENSDSVNGNSFGSLPSSPSLKRGGRRGKNAKKTTKRKDKGKKNKKNQKPPPPPKKMRRQKRRKQDKITVFNTGTIVDDPVQWSGTIADDHQKPSPPKRKITKNEMYDDDW